MGLGLALVACLLIFALVGFMVVQAMFAARRWRAVIRGGDRGALLQLLEMTLEEWRDSRPPKGTPPADWRALHTASLVAADRDRARVSLLVEPDVRVVGGQRSELASASAVARRAAVRMVERLLYEVPHTHFLEVQVDVNREFRNVDGSTGAECLLSTRAMRDRASLSDWDEGVPEALLADWETADAERGPPPDPDLDPLITPEEPQIVGSQAAKRPGSTR